MLDSKKIKEIQQIYAETQSIYQTAKKCRVHRNTVIKYIDIDNIPADKRTLLARYKDNIYKYKYNNIISKDKSEVDISKSDRDIAIQPSKSISRKETLITDIENIITKLIKRYKKEYRDIKVDNLYKHLGTLFDKLMILTGKELQPTSQVIMNFYGDEDKVRKLLKDIRKSKKVTSLGN